MILAFLLVFLPQQTIDEDRIRAWVEQLASDDPRERERATEALVKVGPPVLPHLKSIRCSDVEACDRLALIERRIRQESRHRALSGKVARSLLEDRDLMTRLLSPHPDEVMKGLGLLTGHIASRDSAGFVILQHCRTVDPSADDLAVLLKEILREAPVNDADWAAVQVIALRTVQEYRLPGMIGPVRGLLASPEPVVRRGAVYAASEIGLAIPLDERKALVESVTPLLSDEAADVRSAAVETVGRIGGPERLFGIARMADDADARVRLKVIDAILCWEERKYASVLAELSKDPDAQVRRAAVQGIGALRESSLVADLLPRLQDQDEYVRLEMLNTLAMIRDKQYARQAAPLLKDPCTFVRSRALELLEILEASEFSREVAELLHPNEFETIRARALRILAAFGKADAAPAVARVLRDDSVLLRQMALETLSTIGTRAQSSDVAPLLKDELWGLRQLAAELLLRWGDRSHLDEIYELLDSSDPSVRAGVACALAHTGDKRGLNELLQSVREGEALARAKSLYALNAIAAPVLMKKFGETPVQAMPFCAGDITEILSELQRQTKIPMQTSINAGRTLELPYRGAILSVGVLLRFLAENSDGLYAIILDDDRNMVRIVPPNDAVRYWEKKFPK